MSPLVLWDEVSQSWAEPGGASTPPVGIAPQIITTELDPMLQGSSFVQQIVYIGDPATSASIVGGSAPAGIAPIVIAGVVSIGGTPSTPGPYEFTLRVQNGAGSDTRVFSGTVLPSAVGYESRWQSSHPVTHGDDLTAAITGVYPGITLTTYTGSYNITTPGTVVENKIINGDVNVLALGVIFYNCIVNGYIAIDETAAPDFTYSFEAIDCTVNGGNRQVTCIGTKNFKAIRCRVTGGNRSVYPYHYGEVIECYIDGQWVSSVIRTHASAIRQSQNGKIIRCNFRCDVADVPATGSGASANLTGYGDFETVQYNDIINNHIGWTPGGYGVYGGSTRGDKQFPNGNHIRFMGNRWERGPSGKNAVYGPATDFDPDGVGNVWSDNRYVDGAIINHYGGEGPL